MTGDSTAITRATTTARHVRLQHRAADEHVDVRDDHAQDALHDRAQEPPLPFVRSEKRIHGYPFLKLSISAFTTATSCSNA